MPPMCERLPNSVKILLISTVLLSAAVCVAPGVELLQIGHSKEDDENRGGR
jgi:hypothetical protein